MHWQEDGIGSCHASPHCFDDGMQFVLATKLPDIWGKIAYAQPDEVTLGGQKGHKACPYHEKDKGCILGDVKPARCLRHFDHSDRDEIGEILGSGFDLSGLFHESLDRVMVGSQQMEFPDWLVDPEGNEAFVEQTVAKIEALTTQVMAYEA